jgi:transglutaminase-like putative cysteine protease
MRQQYVSPRIAIIAILANLLLIAITVCFPTMASASDYDIKPRADWVKPITADQTALDKDNQVSRGVYYLLADNQVKVSNAQKTIYRHYTLKALNAQGLDQLGHVEIWFDPSYQKLTLHSVSIYRGNKVINKLNSAKVKILQREKELELRIYDGSKTANIFLEDIQVGDVLDYAYTITGSNPVFKHHQFGSFDLQWGAPVNQIFNRLLLPKKNDVHFTYINSKQAVQIRELADEREYIWERKQVPALIVATETPSWHDAYPYVQWGNFKNWQSVAQWALPLYRIPNTPQNSLQKVINQIAEKHSDAEERMLAALLFVQKEIRYLGVEIGANSHAPNPPDLVLNRRFGDCKDKTLLTLTLLNALGIKAQAALVNTNLRRGIAQLEPSPNAFNHVMVRAQIDGKEYWLDPTRQQQISSLKELYQPNYDFSLLIDANSTALTPMPKLDSQVQKRIVHTLIDNSAGIEQPAKMTITTTYQGISAENTRNSLAVENLDDLQKRYMNYYARYYPSITLASPMKIADDEATSQLRITEYYLVPQFWSRDEEKKRLESKYYSPEIDSLLTRPSQPIRTSPLALSHPIDLEQVTEILLPETWPVTDESKRIEGPGFELTHKIESTEKTITMRDHYISRADHLMPEQVSKHVEAIEQVKNILGYSLWQNDQQSDLIPKNREQSLTNGEEHNTNFVHNFNWTIATLAVLITILWAQLAIRFYRHDPVEQVQSSSIIETLTPRGFGGWLLIPMISITLTPLRILNALSDVDIYRLSNWAALETPSNPAFYSAQIPILIFELAGNIGAFVFTLLLVIFLYKKRSTFPRAYIVIFGAILFFHLCDNILASYFVKVENLELAKEWTSLIVSSIVYVLWALYFTRSERVKATFVCRYQQVHPKAGIMSIHTTTVDAITPEEEIENIKKVSPFDGA